MASLAKRIVQSAAIFCIIPAGLTGCKASGNESNDTASQPPFMSAVASTPPQAADDAPPPEKTGGFDGQRAFAHVAKQVSFGPRPSGSQAISKLQDYLQSELKSYGCNVETDAFTADTPVGRLPMKNFLVKILGEKPGVILLGTHYYTKLLENFVGADDGGSSTGVMLELARLLCKQRGKYPVWIAFFDGEEGDPHRVFAALLAQESRQFEHHSSGRAAVVRANEIFQEFRVVMRAKKNHARLLAGNFHQNVFHREAADRSVCREGVRLRITAVTLQLGLQIVLQF